MGRRVGPSGLQAGKQLDESVTLLIEGGDPGRRPWHAKLARHVLNLLKKGGCHEMKSQVVTWSERKNMATAIDILGRSKDKKTIYIIELKYCSHSLENTKRTYKLAHPETPRLRGMQLANSLYNHHQMQLRETVRFFRAEYDIPAGTSLVTGVVVACGDGGVLFFRLKR
tara:strand:- start:173 stop:679 length:507 start_codon:yes stop_codon:yes gene_type:complete